MRAPRIHAVEMVRKIRDRHARRLAGKSPDEIIAFYRAPGVAATQDAERRSKLRMTDIQTDIAAYEALREGLEVEQTGKWVLIHNQKLVGIFESFNSAAEEAVKQFGRGPYLIRQVGAPPVTLPASVMYHARHHG